MKSRSKESPLRGEEADGNVALDTELRGLELLSGIPGAEQRSGVWLARDRETSLPRPTSFMFTVPLPSAVLTFLCTLHVAAFWDIVTLSR